MELGSIIAKDFALADQYYRTNNSEGFIVIGFKILNSESYATSLDLEGNWIAWTGAREILFLSNPEWQLKRMTFHKNINTNSDGFAYVLLCEYGRLMDQKYSLFACQFIERLRLRHCGSANLYRIEWFVEANAFKSCEEADKNF